jgi:photosystem II stability/assembly factor-like uncharacterized protein
MRTIVAFSLAVILAGCSSSSPSPSPTPTSDGGGSTGWRAIVGEGGTFVHTFDEKEWTVRALGNVDLYGVSCIGNDVGWAVGAHGVIAHTEDGGRTWSWQSSGTTTTLRSVAFGDLQHGIAVGDDGFVRSTIDGGRTWTAPPAGGEALPLHAAFANGATFYAVGASGLLRRGALGALAPQTIAGAGDLTAVAARGTHVAVADESGAVFESFDGGSRFEKTDVAPHAIRALAITETGMVVAAGDAGTIRTSTTKGVWSTASTTVTANLHAAVPTSTGIFFAGDQGTLLVLGGGAVRAIPVATTADLWAVESFE